METQMMGSVYPFYTLASQASNLQLAIKQGSMAINHSRPMPHAPCPMPHAPCPMPWFAGWLYMHVKTNSYLHSESHCSWLSSLDSSVAVMLRALQWHDRVRRAFTRTNEQ
ncbi:hypothetical protein Droror1_Dr00011275 [Drosera rotundifolia]